jgi:hypothetical protein
VSTLSAQVASTLRLLAGWALVLSLFLTPVAPLLAALSDPMACCSKGNVHACCARKAKAAKTNSFQAQAGCQLPCCGKSQVEPSGPAWIPDTPAASAGPLAITPILLAGTGRVRPVALPDPRFQRPPPALLFL